MILTDAAGGDDGAVATAIDAFTSLLVVVAPFAGALFLVLILGKWVFRPIPPRPAPPRPAAGEMRRRWDAAVEEYDAVCRALTAAETDPATIFDRPLIVDVREEATAAFHAALDDARAAHRERPPSDPGTVLAFEKAAARATRAWDAADSNARSKAGRGIGAQGRVYTTGEIADMTQARKLLTLALDTAAPPAEAASAYRRMRALLDPILGTVPAPLEKALTGILSAPQRRLAVEAAG